jgi:hypothetical protein
MAQSGAGGAPRPRRRIGQASAAEALLKRISGGCIGKAEPDMESVSLVPAAASANYNAAFRRQAPRTEWGHRGRRPQCPFHQSPLRLFTRIETVSA